MAVYKIAIEHYPLLQLAESRFAKEKERMKRALRSYTLRNHLSKSWRVKGPRVARSRAHRTNIDSLETIFL